MAKTLQQIENARRTAAFQTFIARTGETFGPFDTAENGEALAAYVLNAWGIDALKNPDSFEIAFASLLAEGKLTKNENYVAASVRAEINSLSGAEVGRRYRRDPEFRKQFDLVANSDADSGQMSDSDPYRTLTADQYLGIPPQQRAELYARNRFFYNATQRLISEGQI